MRACLIAGSLMRNSFVARQPWVLEPRETDGTRIVAPGCPGWSRIRKNASVLWVKYSTPHIYTHYVYLAT